MGETSSHTGIYICTGCGIGESLDISQLEALARDEAHVKCCRSHGCLCGAESLESIRGDLEATPLNAIVIAACSARHEVESFDFGAIYIERVNLREGVAWVMENGAEDTQLAAEDYLRMGLARAAASGIPDPHIPEYTSTEILILGGGITGIEAAIQASRAGYRAKLIEKEQRLGGWLNQWYDIIPSSGAGETHLAYYLREKLEALDASPGIEIFLQSTIAAIEGEPGAFEVMLENTEHSVVNTTAPGSMKDPHPESSDGQLGRQKVRAGAIVLANGWKSYDPNKIKALDYNRRSQVITQIDLENMIREDRLRLKSRPPANVVFIQCVGSRDPEHLPYCSTNCCLTSLKQALYIRRKFPETKVFILYKDMRTPGRYEHFYREVQSDPGIFMTKAENWSIEDAPDQNLKLSWQDVLLGEVMEIRTQLVVAATGMVPNQSEDLHLLYRKGEGLPERKYGFPDSHFICFPYETQRTGIYAAGTVRTPQGIDGCTEDAAGAVVKAIHCIENVRQGKAVHPRVGDQSHPVISFQRCTDCKRCTEECPFGSYDEEEKGTPLPHPARCRRCGICMGSCPERIINFDDYSIHGISSMIKAIPIPDEFEEKPRILALICENDAAPAFDLAALHRIPLSPWLRVITVRCIGSVNKIWLSDALSAGYDGILQIGCKPGEDYQCHFITGSELMETRSENIQETLQTMMLEPERIETVFLEIDEYHKVPEIINNYLETIEEIGPNPFKDM